MIDVHAARRIWLYSQPADLRKGFGGLYAIANNTLGVDPMDGDLFIFLNRRRTLLKALRWDGTGLCVFSKRIAQGRFPNIFADPQLSEALSPHQLEKLIHAETDPL